MNVKLLAYGFDKLLCFRTELCDKFGTGNFFELI